MVSTRNGIISVSTDAYGRSKEFSAYVLNPARKPICRMEGITAFDISLKFNDISEISFEVQRYITDVMTDGNRENPAYVYLHSFCEIYVPELEERGYFILNSEPTINAENTVYEYKSFTAYAYESILQYENLVLFDINQGTETSLEYDYGGEHIRLYWEERPELSLLDLVLKDDYYGWSVGHVDESIAAKALSFSVDNQNVYAFLHSDASVAFRCVFEFNTKEKIINAYDIETIGKDTNIFMSFANFIQKLSIEPSSDEMYTVFNVAGDEDLDIANVNFGSNQVIDISYPLSMVDASLRNKYNSYLVYRESLRDEYVELSYEYSKLVSEKAAIEDRQPDELVHNNWSSPAYTLDDLKTQLETCRLVVSQLETDYTITDEETGEEVIDYDSLNKSTDASIYYSYKDVVIQDLELEIQRRESGDVHIPEFVEQEYVFDLYGLNDLILERDKIQTAIDTYENLMLESTTSDDKYESYLRNKERLDTIDELIAEKQNQLKEIDDEIQGIVDRRNFLAYSASLEAHINNIVLEDNNGETIYADNGEDIEIYLTDDEWIVFTQEEANTIRSMYRESDYQDDNYLVSEYDDDVAKSAIQEELMEAAIKRLDIESHPQLNFTITSDDLFDIEEFKVLRDNLSIGDFIILGFNDINAIRGDATTTSTTSGDDEEEVRRIYYQNAIKLRCVEFDFSGLRNTSDFEMTFSTLTQSKYEINDYESILNDYITSKTNQISVRTANTAATTASKIAASLIRPYIKILNAKIENAEIQSASIQELEAVYGHFTTLLADYLEAETAAITYATVDLLNVDQISSRDGSSWWNLQTGELMLNGYLISTVTEYAVNTSATTAPSSDSFEESDPPNTPPTPSAGEYVWQRIVLIGAGNQRFPSTPVCIQGVKGDPGDSGAPAVSVSGLSSEGLIIKDSTKSTTITVTIHNGSLLITDISALKAAFGNDAKVVWKTKQQSASSYTTVADSDSRISNNGFSFTLRASDIVNAVDVMYEVWA